MSSQFSTPSSSNYGIFNQTARKRRKVRKGTFSCWECKRRKIRCQFPPAPSSVCMNCRRFEVPCIGQDLEEPGENGRNENEERLNRVEALVTELQRQRSASLRKDSRPPQRSRPYQFDLEELPKDFAVGTSVNLRRASKKILGNAFRDPIVSRAPMEDITSRCSSLYDFLQSIVPPSATATLIVTHGKSPFAVLEQPSKVVEGFAADVSCSQRRHPLVLARGLLHLALCLQRLNLNSSQLPDIRFEAPTAIMARRYVDAARQVTSRESFLTSYDGLDALMLESSFETSAGNLQAAWLSIRRALNIAQLIHPYQRISQLTKREQLVWSRLILFDRVLSLMLGLAFDYLANKHSTLDEEGSTSLERRHAATCERIISRNLRMEERLHRERELSDAYDDYEETQNIDHELKQAMRSMPVELWHLPRIPTTPAETAAFADVLHHYDFLVLTHLPYLIHGPHLQPSIDPNGSTICSEQYEYSRFAALSASREVLTRVLLCCRSRHISCSTSGLVHKAFSSSISLLLAHTEGHTLGRGNVLEHQRPADLMLVRDVVDHMEEVTRLSERNLYFNSEALKELLKVEEDAANGNTYIAITASDDQGQQYIGVGGGEICVRFSLPYFGAVRVKRQRTDRIRLVDQSTWPNLLTDNDLTLGAINVPSHGVSGNGECSLDFDIAQTNCNGLLNF